MPNSTCLHELFERQVECVPAAQSAVICEEEEITYSELNCRANQLARHLRMLGAGPETLIGICVERSIEMMVGLLGTLKAGAAYVPCDPVYPAERISAILEEAAPPIVLTQQRLLEQLPAANSGPSVLCLDGDWSEISRQGQNNSDPLAGPMNLAYVMYTSGSTGKPKGISVAHSSAVSFMLWARNMFSPEDLHGVLASTSICFDISLIELLMPLIWGGRIIMAQNALELPELKNRHQVTLINTVPSAMREIIFAHGLPESVRTVILGGEAVDPLIARQVYKQPGVQRVFNLYGPTEDTIYSTWSLLRKDEDKAPIGRSMTGKHAYVLDRRLRLVPIGVTGSVYLAGEGLARGYHNRPDLTAEKFIANPFSKEPGARMYDTGDLARWNNRGELEYVGRSDQQVKIRGYRIELGEIEAVLRQHPGVGQAVVMAREDLPGDRVLVAYITGKGKNDVTPNDLRSFVKQKLPQYMVPSSIVVMETFPLTPNGKLNRKALPAPEDALTERETSYVAPRTPAEEILAGIWVNVLKLKQVGVHDNFFDIGGHSLKAVQVVARVRDAFGVEIPVRKVFETPTISGLAQLLAVQPFATVANSKILPVLRNGPLPLSFSEEALRFMARLFPNRPTFNMIVAARLIGELDTAALEKSINAIIRRHEILCTTFRTSGGHPVRIISEPATIALQPIELRNLPSNGEAELFKLVAQESTTPFDLARGPLLRFKLLRMSTREHAMVLALPHLIADGWSMGILLRELQTLYASYRKGESAELPGLPIQYADYAVWIRQRIRGELLDRLTSYWKQRLQGLSARVQLPGITESSASRIAAVHNISFHLSQVETDALRKFSKGEGVTLFVTLLTAFKLLVHRLTRAEDIVVVVPTSERSHSELEGIIGLFMNFFFLRTDLSGEPTFRELLGRIRDTSREAGEHQDLPYAILLKSLHSVSAGIGESLFQFGFNYVNLTETGVELEGVRTEIIRRETRPEQISDLMLHVSDNDQTLHLYVICKESILPAARMMEIGEQLKGILRGILREQDVTLGT
jgi:amino acid adenylation domain-containing protein